jgi:hypothetical protein
MKDPQRVPNFEFSILNSKLKTSRGWSCRRSLTLGSILFFLLFPPRTFAQNQLPGENPRSVFRDSKSSGDTLAIVNGQPVTSADFLYRYELSLFPERDFRDTTKMEFLYSMIAEKLLSQEGAKSDEPLTSSENEVAREMNEMFLRDALCRAEVLPLAKPTRVEIERGVSLSAYSYLLDAFYFSDSVSARRFYVVSSEHGKNIYKLADSMGVSHDTLEIGYGESTEDIEDAVFGNKKGFISPPVLTVDGWVVFKIIGRNPNKKFTGAATEDRAAIVQKVIESRKETELGARYLSRVMKGVEVHVNYDIFRQLVREIQRLISTKHPESFDPYYYLSAQDLLTIRNDFENELSQPLLAFKGGSLTLDRILDELPLSGFHSIDTTIPEITVGLHSALRFISQNYFLARKARQLGFENSNEVKYNVQMFLNAYRSARIAEEVTDTVQVSPQEIDNFFQTHQDEVLNGIQLKLRTFEAANIDEVAGMYSRLMEDQKRGRPDTSGQWTRASKLGETGAVLAQLKNGSLYGPVFDNGKFCIYRVIDKRSEVRGKSIDVAREMALETKRERVLSEYVADLAAKAGVEFDYPNIRDLRVTDIQMLTLRYIGFGGKILAVPMLFPRYGWIQYYSQRRPPAP